MRFSAQDGGDLYKADLWLEQFSLSTHLHQVSKALSDAALVGIQRSFWGPSPVAASEGAVYMNPRGP